MYRPWMGKRGLPFAGGPISVPANIPIPALPTAKSRHRAMLVGGRVWVVGGSGVKTYSWASGETSWTTEADMPAGTHESWNTTSGMAILGFDPTKIFLIGGAPGVTNNKTDIFDTVARTWSSSAAYGGGVGLTNKCPAEWINGFAALFGYNFDAFGVINVSKINGNLAGTLSSGIGFGNGAAPVIVRGSNNWVQSMGDDLGLSYTVGGGPVQINAVATWKWVGSPAVKLNSGNWLITGGTNGGGVYYANTCEWDGLAAAVTNKGAMATARTNHGAAKLADGRIIVWGGQTTGIVLVASTEIYDPNTGTWSAAGNLPSARQFPGVVTLADGTVLSVGGDDAVGAITECLAFDVATLTWKTYIANPDA